MTLIMFYGLHKGRGLYYVIGIKLVALDMRWHDMWKQKLFTPALYWPDCVTLLGRKILFCFCVFSHTLYVYLPTYFAGLMYRIMSKSPKASTHRFLLYQWNY